MQQIQAKRKVGEAQRKFERRSRNDSRTQRPAILAFVPCKNHKETIPAHKIWISSIAQSMCCRPSSLLGAGLGIGA